MDLLYLYLDKYKNFNKEAFSFSTEYIITSNITEERIDVLIEFNKDYIRHFFGDPKIINVTGIIGQNGAGKSNLLDFIRNSFPDGVGGFREECIVLTREYANPGHEYLKLFYTPGLNVHVTDKTGLVETHQLPPRETTGPLTTNYSIPGFSNTDFTYYSNIVDLKIPSNFTRTKIEWEDEPGSSSRFHNISTQAMLMSDPEAYTNSPKLNIDRIDAYKAREFGRNIEFIASEHKKKIDFSFPKEIIVYNIQADERSLLNNNKNTWLRPALEYYKDEFSYDTGDDTRAYFNNFLKAMLLNFVRTITEFSQLGFNENYINRPNKPKSFHKFFLLTIQKLRQVANHQSGDFSFSQKAEAMAELADFVAEYIIKQGAWNVRTYDEPILRLEINEEGLFAFSRFVDSYVGAKSITDFLNFKFRNLSSGEQSQLMLLSRFYRLSKTLKNDFPNHDLIILMDEPDVYFHPEWQRKTLHQIVTYLPTLFPFRRLQLIITSNTSYLASDLPRQNIILIKGTMQDAHSEQIGPLSTHTFGANIHTLLSDSFFVTNLMGEFAKTKIEQLADFFQNDKTKYDFSERDAQLMINWIGEPIIRDRLQELFNNYFPLNTETLNERKEQLLAELHRINQIIAQDNNEKNN